MPLYKDANYLRRVFYTEPPIKWKAAPQVVGVCLHAWHIIYKWQHPLSDMPFQKNLISFTNSCCLHNWSSYNWQMSAYQITLLFLTLHFFEPFAWLFFLNGGMEISPACFKRERRQSTVANSGETVDLSGKLNFPICEVAKPPAPIPIRIPKLWAPYKIFQIEMWE